jgi:fermentation-respiration switch protein FrsA (DUF1100 family)
MSSTKVFYPSYPNKEIKIAALVFYPRGFDENKKYPAIVVKHPTSGCKEQTSSIYASKLAEFGYVTIAPDATYQGESGGEPRFLEYAPQRVQDFSCAIDYLVNQKYVDEDRIGVLGICASGGYSVPATMTDRRVKALGTVVGANVGRVWREGVFLEGGMLETLEAISKQRTIEARGGEIKYDPIVFDTVEQLKESPLANEIDVAEATEYYRTPRGQAKGSQNRLSDTSYASIFTFDAYHLAEKLLTQPLAIIVGKNVGLFGSYRDGWDLYDKAASKDKFIYELPDTSHYDLYDKPESVEIAIGHLKEFYGRYL